MSVWAIPVQELPVQDLLVLAPSMQQALQRELLAQRAWALVRGSGAVHRVQAGFHDFQSMKWPAASRAHSPFAARLI